MQLFSFDRLILSDCQLSTAVYHCGMARSDLRLNGGSKKSRQTRDGRLLCYYAVDKTIISNFARVPRFASFNMPGCAVEVLSSGDLTAK